MRSSAAAIFAPLAAAAALAALCLWRPPRVSASLYDLAGAAADMIPRFMREAAASEVGVVVSSKDAAAAEAAAREFATLPGAGRRDLPPEALDWVRARRGALAAPETAALLETPEGRARLARRATRRLYVSPAPPVLGYADDPFGITDDFLVSLGRGAGEAIQTNGVTSLLVRVKIDSAAAERIDGESAALARLEAMAAAAAERGVEVQLSGAPVHTAAAAARSRRELAWLTSFSLVFILVLSRAALGGWRRIGMVAAALATAALSGGAAMAACFRELHAISLVMGTVVLGLAVDYSFHWFMSAPGEAEKVRRNLVVSWLTTEISLLPLGFSEIPVLRQTAVFLAAALAAALWYVLAAFSQGMARRGAGAAAVPRGARVALRWAAAAVAGAALCGAVRMKAGTEMSALYAPPPELAAAEQARARFGGFDLAALPGPEARRRNAENLRKLYAEHGAAMAAALGLEKLEAPVDCADAPLLPREIMDGVFGAWTRDALRGLGWSAAAMLAALFFAFGRRAVRIMVPPLAALAVVAGLLGFRGEPANVFHLLAGFLLLGMSVDYAVFLQGDGALRAAFTSLLTSMAGFGALALASFPVVAAFGTVLAVGLPVAFAAAVACGGAERGGEGGGGVERGASPLGMEALWIVYCVFGLRALRFGAWCVGAAVWLSSAAVRRASPQLGRATGFAQSLADKLAVMAQGRDLPRVETDGGADAAAFVAEVAAGRGVFVLSSHCGAVEMLIALGECCAKFHAWTDLERTAVFSRFYLRHARRRRVELHPVSEMGVTTAFWAADALEAGDCMVMAGDRGRGAFRFAHALGHSVYFAACVREGRGYRAILRRLEGNAAQLEEGYRRALDEVAAAHPLQNYNWEG